MHYKTITFDPLILNGKPIIAGSRISVEIILEWLATGATVKEIYAENKHLPKGSVEEAIIILKHKHNNFRYTDNWTEDR
jgi:uncharacterized protein (DUF433 family)